MRINKYVALKTGLSRRAADVALTNGRIIVNGKLPEAGQQVDETDNITLDGKSLGHIVGLITIMLNKPIGYICSRDGQGNPTVYELLPPELHQLKPVGRLDKLSSGLLLLTNDGQLAQEMTHPKYGKSKTYKIALKSELSNEHENQITHTGVQLEDGISKLELTPINNQRKEWLVKMSEGRNRQIRRTFDALGHNVVKLHRTQFGKHKLGSLTPGKFEKIEV